MAGMVTPRERGILTLPHTHLMLGVLTVVIGQLGAPVFSLSRERERREKENKNVLSGNH